MKMYLTPELKEILEAGPGTPEAQDMTIRTPFETVKMEAKEDQEDDLARAMITTESVDRDSDIVVATGGQLANYKNNPVVLFGHNYWAAEKVVGKAMELVVHPNQGIESAWMWADEVNPEAATVKGLWDGGFLNAVSIGFIPLQWERRTDEAGEALARGWKFTEWELVEFSVVPVPANQDALRMALNLVDPDAIMGTDQGQVKELLDRIGNLEKQLAELQPDQATMDLNNDADIEPVNQDINEPMAKLFEAIHLFNESMKGK